MPSEPPKKVLFAHTPKAAGVHLIEYFRTRLGYAQTQSTATTDEGVWLDFTVEQLLEHLDGDGFVNTHVLAAGWSDLVQIIPAASPAEIVDAIRRFRARGWFVFTFVRHPGEHLCSFYHYVLDAQRRGWDAAVRLHARHFDHEFEPGLAQAHASGSKGYAHYCATGEISADTQARIEASQNMRIYREIAGQGA